MTMLFLYIVIRNQEDSFHIWIEPRQLGIMVCFMWAIEYSL